MTAEQRYKSFLTSYAEKNTAGISVIVSPDGRDSKTFNMEDIMIKNTCSGTKTGEIGGNVGGSKKDTKKGNRGVGRDKTEVLKRSWVFSSLIS